MSEAFCWALQIAHAFNFTHLFVVVAEAVAVSVCYNLKVITINLWLLVSVQHKLER